MTMIRRFGRDAVIVVSGVLMVCAPAAATVSAARQAAEEEFACVRPELHPADSWIRFVTSTESCAAGEARKRVVLNETTPFVYQPDPRGAGLVSGISSAELILPTSDVPLLVEVMMLVDSHATAFLDSSAEIPTGRAGAVVVRCTPRIDRKRIFRGTVRLKLFRPEANGPAARHGPVTRDITENPPRASAPDVLGLRLATARAGPPRRTLVVLCRSRDAVRFEGTVRLIVLQ